MEFPRTKNTLDRNRHHILTGVSGDARPDCRKARRDCSICRRYQVARLEVFGTSALGTDFDPETSDADFLVECLLESGVSVFGHIRLARDLGGLLGRKVDLVELSAIRSRCLLVAIDEAREVVYEQTT